MKCPHCDENLPSRECPECRAATLLEGKFCAFCGTELPHTDSAGPDDIDFSDRILCSDGTCIGVINEQGVCGECGKPYAAEPEQD